MVFDNILLKDLEVALEVAEVRSITAAANNLDLQVATASAALKRVESALGVDLFNRTTRRLMLSAAGECYLPQCKKALQMLVDAKQNMMSETDIVEGDIRIALSSDLGRNFVLNWLDDFTVDYPQLKFRVHVSDTNIDFYRDSLDMALRYGVSEDSNLYGFKICNVPRVLCATKEYIKEYGVPKHPNDLLSHNGLFYELNGLTYDVWTFYKGNQKFKIKMAGDRSSNDGDVVRRWCLANKGLALKSCLDMSWDLLSGNVIRLLPEFKTQETELWLVCPSRQSIVPAVRLLRDHSKRKTAEILQKLTDGEFI